MHRFQAIWFFFILGFLAIATMAHAGVTDLGVWQDAQVVQGHPSSYYGGVTNLYVAGAAGGSYLNERAWLKFNLDGAVPPGAVIDTARLRLFCWKADDAEDMSAAVHASSNDTWDEDSLNWNTQPSFDTTAMDSVVMAAGRSGYWVEWDVTGAVRSEAAGDRVATMVVKAAVEGADPYQTFAFDAKEYSASLAPRLRIEYTGQWPTAAGFKIFHMNDAHSRLQPHDFDLPDQADMPVLEQTGGAACFATRMLTLKAADPESLVLDAGDISEGGALGDVRGNGGMIDFYNLLDAKLKALGGRGIDAVVVGNHDLRSVQMLANMRDKADFPCISVNVCAERTQTPYFSPYVIVTVNGTRVGILGYTNDESSYLGADIENAVDVVKCVWQDRDPATIDIKDKVEHLRSVEGCDVVILLSHMGHTRIITGEDAVLADTGGVIPPEIVISGHWHTWTGTVWQPAQLNYKTIIAEAASYLQYIGELEVTGAGKLVQARKHPIRNSEIAADADVAALIAALTAEYDAGGPAHGLDQVVGYSAVDLTLDKDKWWTVSEYPWNATNSAGAWICDAMRWQAGQLGFTADMAFQSGGGIRRDNARGWITYREIYEAYPWSDDAMVRITLPGSAIKAFIQEGHCGVSLSDGLLVTAEDGLIRSITLNGVPVADSTDYPVLISAYMHAHEFTFSQYTPETVVDGDGLPVSIREALVRYTGQYDPANPMTVPGPRYSLDTELAGGFTAVVTMVADSEREPYYEHGFIRLLGALPETVTRRAYYGLTDLVNADGAINAHHPFAETMFYRGYLGFKDGLLKNGDIIEIWVEGGFYNGNAQLVEQEGVQSDGLEFKIVGHDPGLARSDDQPNISALWNEAHENRYVCFYAVKTGDTAVTDSDGFPITIYQPGGYHTMNLPGRVGDLLRITGVQTQESATTRRFRCRSAVVASTGGFPPYSAVDAVTPGEQSAATITLTATAGDAATSGSFAAALAPAADTQVAEGYPDGNNGARTYLYIQSADSGASGYEDERAWLKFDLGAALPEGADITSAALKLYCRKAQNGDMAVSVHGAEDDSWTESGLTWNNQPAYGTALSAATLTAGATNCWYAWDVTSRVQTEWRGDKNVSLAARPVSEGSAVALTYAFESREWSVAENRPKLEVAYTAALSGGELASVEFYYRYAQDGMNWSSWQSAAAADTQAPWQIAFAYPQGYGYYQFYSVAADTDGNTETAPITADAHVRYTSGTNTAPNPAANTGVPDGASDQAPNQLLSVTVADADSDFVDVWFYTGDDELIGRVDNVGTGRSASVFWLNLDPAADYHWYVVVDDGIDATRSDTWSFATQARASPVVPVLSVGLPVGMAAAMVVFAAGWFIIRRIRQFIQKI